MKHCTYCEKYFPATPEFFYRRAASADGLQLRCTPYELERVKEYQSQPEVKARRNAYQEVYSRQPKEQIRISAWSKAYYSRPDVRERQNALKRARRAARRVTQEKR